uniref:NTR domain-containing protein n=1 Tax=Ascaris lumbricoides TaxID=6252 RepID=A0A9J2QAY5_ASCLU
MQITKLQLVFIVIECLFFAATYGCTCQSQTPLQSYCRADWVSHLRVKFRVTKQPMPNNPLRKGFTNIRYGAHHIRIYKVPPQFANSTLPTEIFTPSEAAACGLVLEAGKEYLLAGG